MDEITLSFALASIVKPTVFSPAISRDKPRSHPVQYKINNLTTHGRDLAPLTAGGCQPVLLQTNPREYDATFDIILNLNDDACYIPSTRSTHRTFSPHEKSHPSASFATVYSTINSIRTSIAAHQNPIPPPGVFPSSAHALAGRIRGHENPSELMTSRPNF